MSNSIKAFVKYRDPITSKDLNQARIGFFPKGRYLGFDKFEDSDNPGFVVELTNKTFLKYYDEERNSKNVGLAVSPQGVILHLESPHEINLEGFSNPTQDLFFVLILSYLWENTTQGIPPLIHLRPSTNYPNNPESFITSPESEIVLGVVKVKQGATNANGIELYPAEAPQFAWGSEDLTQVYARLHFHNYYTKSQIHTLATLFDDAIEDNILNLGDLQSGQLILSHNQSIHSIISNYPLQGYTTRLVWLTLSASSNPITLNKVPNGNLDIPKSLTLRPRDSVLLGIFGTSVRVLGAFSYHESQLKDVAHTNSNNNWQVPQSYSWGGENTPINDLISQGVLTLPNKPIHSLRLHHFHTLNRIEVDGGVPIGTRIKVILMYMTDTDAMTLTLNGYTPESEPIIINGHNQTFPVVLRAGVYTLTRIEFPGGDQGWAIEGNFASAEYPGSQFSITLPSGIVGGITSFNIQGSKWGPRWFLKGVIDGVPNIDLMGTNVNLNNYGSWPTGLTNIMLRFESRIPNSTPSVPAYWGYIPVFVDNGIAYFHNGKVDIFEPASGAYEHTLFHLNTSFLV